MKILDKIQRIQLFCTIALSFFTFFLLGSCEDFVELDPPRTETVRETLFSTDETSIAAMNGVYAEMILQSRSMFAGILEVTTGLVSDEFVNNTTRASLIEFQTNNILPINLDIFQDFWQQSYRIINNANGVIEGLNDNPNISQEVRNQLIGEALFIRAYVHFYLTNLFGPIPYINSTDVEINSGANKLSIEGVYEQILIDLNRAQPLLSVDYSFIENGRRVRVNRGAADAFLARIYLYLEDWSSAEQFATEVIGQSNLYLLEEDLNDVFLIDSNEAILQLASINSVGDVERSYLADLLVLSRAPFSFSALGATSMSDELFLSFEPGDLRFINWVGTFANGSNDLNFPNKYKNPSRLETGISEHTTLLRLGEQYLIRAEARARLGNITGSETDLNVIRSRAGLDSFSASNSEALIMAIMKERRVELFAENGHRWFDLKRTNSADSVLGPLKGDDWQSTDVLFPIPEREIANNSNLLPQNPG